MYEGRKGYVTTHFCECWLLIKNTTAVISRQFRDMSRAPIESLLASFPKLIPTGTQHTSVETADVRYVYQPLEDLYILLITNKASNILQDIETLFGVYSEDPALGSPFGTGNETFGLDPLYKLTSAVFGDMTFQASRRMWIQAAAGAGVPTYGYLFADPPSDGTAPRLGGTCICRLDVLRRSLIAT